MQFDNSLPQSELAAAGVNECNGDVSTAIDVTLVIPTD
jgi:hypothetical protein